MEFEVGLKIALGLVGGLGIFLLGMKNMSEGMQAVAGTTLRKMINSVTGNRFMATGVGTFVTCVVQSSSVTTVLVVGSVNGGVMTLSQAIGVIMGANIGTTITGWILVLKIGKYGLPLLGLAALFYLFLKNDRWRYWALFFMGVGMVFFGLEIMKDACAVIKEMEGFESWFQRFEASTYLGIWKCVLVGCVLTMVVQSSSATLGITISLASQGVISYETAAALVLGENIGTTITAYLASLGTTVNARRAAYFHMIFNVAGVLWITAIFPWYIELVQKLVDVDVTQVFLEPDGTEVYKNTTPAIAATHSIFNVVNTILFLPFVNVFVRLLERVVPSKAYKEKPHLTDLELRLIETPLLAIEQSRHEIIKMGEGCEKMLGWLKELLPADEQDEALIQRLRRREQVLDNIQDEIAVFVTNLLAHNVPHAVAEEARQQLRMADEYESVSDYLISLAKFDRRLRKDGLRFTPEQTNDLLSLHELVDDFVSQVNAAYREPRENLLSVLAGPSKAIRSKIKKLRASHLDELSVSTIPPSVTVAFMAALNSYSRVRDHSLNIAEAISGEK